MMAEDHAVTLYNAKAITDPQQNEFQLKVEAVQTLRGGVIVHVCNLQQARIAEAAGACAVTVTDPPSPGISRMTDPSLVKNIKRCVSIPVLSRVRVGHFVEAQILEAIGVDYIDESEALAVADDRNFINKNNFQCPFVCGARNLGEALRRIREGAAMIRIQGELMGYGNVDETVKSVRCLMGEWRALRSMKEDEVFAFSKEIEAPYDMVAQTKQMGMLPVVHFAAGGIVTPADAALMMQLGCHGVFVGSEVFACEDPLQHVMSIVQAVRNYNDPRVLVEYSYGLDESDESMQGSANQ
ncbi:Pyridoxal 5'-phosphate synthase subunit PDX1.2 [Spatholobus suberectus]|nr:Pyridoxal 5'-phosphate synthase subunit PDX1.2 [Spatholobus suberectus]